MFAGLAVGCSPHLAGTNDAALVYTLEADPGETTPTDVRTAAQRVKARLIAAGVTADVEKVDLGTPSTPGLRVVVDADEADPVNALLLWRGDLAFYRDDDAANLIPDDARDLRRVAAPGPAANADGGWQGPTAAVARAIRANTLDRGHLALLEPLGDGNARTRVARLPALAGQGATPPALASLDLAQGGRALALSLHAEAQSALRAIAKAEPTTRLVVARDRTVLAVVPIAQALETPLVTGIAGDRGIAAYSHAYRVRELLSSPMLPLLARASAVRLPTRLGLASACALLPFILSFAWLLFLRRFDRTRPEPMWLVTVTFALGGVSVIPAAIVEGALASATPWLDPSVVTLGGQLRALPLAIAVFTLTVGLVEEGAKWLAAWSLAAHRREFDEPVDGIIYGSAASLGFAAVENVKYFALGRMSGVLIAARTFMTVPAHMFFGAIWGYAMGRHLLAGHKGKGAWLGLFGLAALAHGVFDATLSTDGLQLLATPLVLALAVTFVALLRRALRHGAVSGAREDAVASSAAASFRVGSSAAFYGCAAAMIVSAFAVTVLGTYYELLHHRVGALFVASASLLLALFGFASYGAAETLPLDVVVDALGFTFAGARTPGSAIANVEVETHSPTRAFVRVDLGESAIRLGPAPALRAHALASAIAELRSREQTPG